MQTNLRARRFSFSNTRNAEKKKKLFEVLESGIKK